MPVKDLSRLVTDATGANRNWEILFGLRTDQVEFEEPTEDLEPANKAYVDSQIDAVSAGTDFGFIDGKGEIPVGSADNIVDNLAAGVNDTILMADSGETLGVKWAPSASPGATINAGDAASEGTADTWTRTDHQHAVSTATAGTILPDDAAAEGSATSLARSDHTHAIAAAVAGTIAPDDAAAEGVSTSFARADHTHAITAATAATLTGSNAEGVATSFARSDHNHALGGTVAGVLEGSLPNPGLAASVAGGGLTESSDVLAVGAGTGITVAADSVAVNTSVIQSWVPYYLNNEDFTIPEFKQGLFSEPIDLDGTATLTVDGVLAGVA